MRRMMAMCFVVMITAGLVWAAQGGSLKVAVTYNGNGEVSAISPIAVAVFSSPPLVNGYADSLTAAALPSSACSGECRRRYGRKLGRINRLPSSVLWCHDDGVTLLPGLLWGSTAS